MALVMYVVLRKDLLSALQWPLGALITQAAHASTAVIWENRDNQDVIDYMADIDHMRKITLQVDSEEDIKKLAVKLKDAGITHKLWIEQPENIPACIAVKPYPKTRVQSFMKGLKLFS